MRSGMVCRATDTYESHTCAGHSSTKQYTAVPAAAAVSAKAAAVSAVVSAVAIVSATATLGY
jgi:arabinogalactan endo-1,4-beta-galactosidase